MCCVSCIQNNSLLSDQPRKLRPNDVLLFQTSLLVKKYCSNPHWWNAKGNDCQSIAWKHFVQSSKSKIFENSLQNIRRFFHNLEHKKCFQINISLFFRYYFSIFSTSTLKSWTIYTLRTPLVVHFDFGTSFKKCKRKWIKKISEI